MLTIELLNGDEVADRITIGKPTPEGADYTCLVSIDGGPEHPVFGVTPLDTLENALTLAKASASRYTPTGWRVS